MSAPGAARPELAAPHPEVGLGARIRGARAELLIAALALALRLALFLAVGSWDPVRLEHRIFVGDAPEYHRLAVNLAEHGVYSSKPQPPLRPNIFRVPLYPAYVSLFYRVAGPRPHLAILAQLVLGALTAVVVCRLGTILFDRRAGITAGTIFALDYSAVLFSNRLYADTLFTLLVALGLLSFARGAVVERRPAAIGAAGLMLGLATLCRPVSLYFPVALAAVLWLASRRWEGKRLVAALASWLIFAVIYLATLGPWMLRNLEITGRPYVTSMQASVGDWYLPRFSGAPLSGTTVPVGGSVVTRLAGDARSFARGFVRYFAILGSGEYPLILGIHYGRHDFVALREASLSGWIEATLHNRSSLLERSIVIAILLYLIALYLAAARGVWIAVRSGKGLAAALLLVTIAYFMVATGPIAREVRYRLPALPAIVALAGLGVTAPRRGAPVSPRSGPSDLAQQAGL